MITDLSLRTDVSAPSVSHELGDRVKSYSTATPDPGKPGELQRHAVSITREGNGFRVRGKLHALWFPDSSVAYVAGAEPALPAVAPKKGRAA